MPEDKPIVYVETSVISYYTAKPSNNVVTAGHQQSTWQWWRSADDYYFRVISEAVYGEIARGDALVAKKRIDTVAAWPMLTESEFSKDLFEKLSRRSGDA